MANFNKVVLIGRFTRDPEAKATKAGGTFVNFGFVVNDRKKQGNEWVDDPMFIDGVAFNRGEYGKTADIIRDKCRKGSQAMLECKLRLEQWDDRQTGAKRSKHVVIVDSIQLLDPKPAAGGNERPAPRPQDDYGPSDDGGEIPF